MKPEIIDTSISDETKKILSELQSQKFIKPAPDSPGYYKPAKKAPVKKERVVTKSEKLALRDQALQIADELAAELELYQEPRYNLPTTWMLYSVSELERGDALQIDGVIYVYLKRLAWWRNKIANVLVAQHHNPDKQKRIGDLDFVYGFKGYVRHQQLAKMGVEL